MTFATAVRWVWDLFFVGGFICMVLLSFWAFVTITRLKQEQSHALSMLSVLVQRAELKKQIDKIQQS